ncbi:hypothetical protein EGW08_014102 [Elysia chlorotica]|uniref:Uncharacterized protein n=1 Tax=Elysia chlorotica TaxID=188477 RepID=A0A433T960_ELYCH|nr:hypothetical protein EGW08_014102 [Elysia chlorotica]
MKYDHQDADYHCENGVYQDLSDLALAARLSAYAPFLSRLRKKQTHVSGQDIADHMQRYCALTNKIIWSQKYMMKHIKCLKEEVQNYELMVQKSDSFCLKQNNREKTTPSFSIQNETNSTGTTEQPFMNVAPTGLMEGIGAISLRTKKAKFDPGQYSVSPVILKILQSLPLEHLDYSQNPCYYQAPIKAYRCYRRYSRHVGRNSSDFAYMLKRKASSLRCTFRSMARICPKKRAFLLTIMEFDWMIVPPALDINVGNLLYRAWRMKVNK